MTKKILALCDKEEIYLYHLAEYLQEKKTLPFAVYAFTGREELKRFSEKHSIDILLIAESCYREEKAEIAADSLIVLNESKQGVGEDIKNINKYQSSEKIYREILKIYAGGDEEAYQYLSSGGRMKLIGNYSPVKRCLQTTFSMSLGQILAKEHKVLYMNLESFSGLGYLLGREFPMDITDVLYFFNCEKGKLAYRLAGIVQTVNNLDFIPPVVSYKDIHMVTGEQWIALFREIESISDYEYLILDLSEQMDGLFDILRYCHRVYTIVREDGFAAAKIKQYEAMLRMEDYEDVAAKTRKWMLPVFHTLPSGLDQLTHGELAAFIKKIAEEDIYERAG